MLTKQETLSEKGTRAERRRVREPRGTSLPRGSKSRGLRGCDYLPGGLWPVTLIQGPSWWLMYRSAKVDARERDPGRWSDLWHLLLTFLELFRLVAAPVLKQLMQMVAGAPGQGGRSSQFASPNSGGGGLRPSQ